MEIEIFYSIKKSSPKWLSNGFWIYLLNTDVKNIKIQWIWLVGKKKHCALRYWMNWEGVGKRVLKCSSLSPGSTPFCFNSGLWCPIQNSKIQKVLKTKFSSELTAQENRTWIDSRLFTVFIFPSSVSIHVFCCRNMRVFNYGVLPQASLGLLYMIII